MSENRSRFVLLCQQALACAVVVAVAAPAAGVAELDIVAPAPAERQGRSVAGDPVGSLVAADAVEPSLTEVPITADGDTDPARSQDPTRGRGAQRIALMASTAPAAPETEPVETRDGGERVVTEPQDVDGYATVGVTWDTGTRLEEDEIRVQVRTLEDGDWSDWQDVHYDADHGPDPGSEEAEHQRFGTDAVVVGDVDDVQVKAVTADTELPDDMRLAIVDPGRPEHVAVEEPAIDTAELASASTTEDPAQVPTEPPSTTDPSTTDPSTTDPSTTDPSTTDPSTTDPSTTDPSTTDPGNVDTVDLAGTPAKVTPKPKIFSRAQWGADERLRDRGSLSYFEVHAGFVHHTVNANRYSRAQVPSIIRGIYAYHTRGRGWSDVGYNFLVDRFGRIWEGRYGGVDRPVVGAHTLGYNEEAFAMSAIGNFETARPSAAMIDAYARLFAWKLSLHGVEADSRRQWVAGRRMPAIQGHRDVGQTACPGRHLYARVGEIRRRAAALQLPFGPRGKDNDLSGSHWPDLVVRDRDTKEAFVVRTGGQLGFDGAGRAASRWSGKDLVAATGDLDGDEVPDMLARSADSGLTGLHPGDGAGDFASAAVREFRQFRRVDQLIAVGDLNGDGNNDVAGRNARSGRLHLWPGNGNGRFRKPKLLSADWSGYEVTAGAGDLDGDGHADLVARDGDNQVWLIHGTGRNALGDREPLAAGWGGYDVISGLGDVTNDGDPDLVVRSRRSQLTYIYPGDGRGGLQHRLGGFTKFGDVDFLAAAGDVTGDGAADLVGRNKRGHLMVWENNRQENVARIVSAGERFPDANLLLNVGDWDGDGHNDLLSRRASDGDLLFHAGKRGVGFEEPVRAGTAWNRVGMVAAVGDITGDGFPDLLAQHRRGGMRIYPGDGRHGFRRWYVAHSRINATDQVGAGLWNRDGSPDSIVRRDDGRLVLYPGNGPGGLTNPRPVGGGANRYDWLVGAGDVDGDNRPDVIGRDRSGRLWLLPGHRSGFDRRRYIGDGFERFDLVG